MSDALPAETTPSLFDVLSKDTTFSTAIIAPVGLLVLMLLLELNLYSFSGEKPLEHNVHPNSAAGQRLRNKQLSTDKMFARSFFAASVAGIPIGIVRYRNVKRLLGEGVRVEAKVVKTNFRSHGQVSAQIEYSFQDKVYRPWLTLDSGTIAEGRMALLVDPQRPKCYVIL